MQEVEGSNPFNRLSELRIGQRLRQSGPEAAPTPQRRPGESPRTRNGRSTRFGAVSSLNNHTDRCALGLTRDTKGQTCRSGWKATTGPAEAAPEVARHPGGGGAWEPSTTKSLLFPADDVFCD